MENLTRFDWNKEISEFTASDIMTQRNKVELINLDWSEDHIKNIIMGFSHHTIPVVKGMYNNFIGVVKINELYEALIKNHGKIFKNIVMQLMVYLILTRLTRFIKNSQNVI